MHKVLEGRSCILKVLVSKLVQDGFNNLSSFIYQRKYVKRKGKCSVGTKHWDDEKVQGKKKGFRKTTKMKLGFFLNNLSEFILLSLYI